MRAAIVILFALTQVAHASVDSEDPPGPPPPPPQKSEDAAFWWSAGGTLASVGFLGAGALLYAATPQSNDINYQPTRLLKVPLHNWGNGLMTAGILSSTLTPSLGEWYAHHFITGGMGLRALGLVVIGIGGLAQTCIDPADLDCHPSNGTGLFVVGGLLYAGGVVYDIAEARDAAHDYNKRIRAAVAPARIGSGYGLVLGGSF